MKIQIVYLANDNDILLKRLLLLKRLKEYKDIIVSDRQISRKTGLIFITASYDNLKQIIIDNKDLLKFYDNGDQRAIVVA